VSRRQMKTSFRWVRGKNRENGKHKRSGRGQARMLTGG